MDLTRSTTPRRQPPPSGRFFLPFTKRNTPPTRPVHVVYTLSPLALVDLRSDGRGVRTLTRPEHVPEISPEKHPLSLPQPIDYTTYMAEGVPMTIVELTAQVVADRVDARERIQEAKNVFTLRLQEIRARLDTIEQQLTP